MRITGYTYRADTYCPACIGREIGEFVRDTGADLPDDPNRWQVEAALDAIAEVLGVDREDEYSFDSGDFPKVVLSLDDDGITCGQCGKPFE